MLGVSVRPRRLKQTKMREYLMRFVFGGVVAVGAGLVGNWWGAVIGGLFLAFPSILPASLTLVKGHAKLSGAAGADALGAALGSLGLVAFAVVGLATSHTGAGLVDVACCLLDLDSRCRHRLDCVPVLAPGASTRRLGGCQPRRAAAQAHRFERQSTQSASLNRTDHRASATRPVRAVPLDDVDLVRDQSHPPGVYSGGSGHQATLEKKPHFTF